MFNGTRKRWKIAMLAKNSKMTRIFAVLEILCFYISIMAIGAMIIHLIVLKTSDSVMSSVMEGVYKILL
ncbi:MAG: hypothetical protein Q4B70_19430, partial [Lachnospiraceae bacterium]|nr:hypothetical protein [Lachnospiraceae bacterium]